MTGKDQAGRVPRERAGPPGDALAARVLITQRRLRSAELPAEARARLQCRLAASCDATKAPGADSGRIAWRLDRLLADITAGAGKPGSGGNSHSRRL